MKRSVRADRQLLLAELGRELPAFQDAAYTVDEAAAAVLALPRNELRCLDHLQASPLGERELRDRSGLATAEVRAALRRLELAGYVQRAASTRTPCFEITQYAREWISELWHPIRDEGRALIEQLHTSQLAAMARFLREGRELQQRHAARIRALLEEPKARRRPSRRRGGLSPAALQRVHLYIHAHLDRPIPVLELAERADLSAYHFARAFKVTTGETPRAYVERLRIARAEALVRDRSLTLAQIAIVTGFASQSSFTTAFRRATGFTPAQYRRNTLPVTSPGE